MQGIGQLVSVENGPRRNVELVITTDLLSSEISSPGGRFIPSEVTCYEIADHSENGQRVLRLFLPLVSGLRVCFYATHSEFDLVLLMDQLDATIGERPRSRA